MSSSRGSSESKAESTDQKGKDHESAIDERAANPSQSEIEGGGGDTGKEADKRTNMEVEKKASLEGDDEARKETGIEKKKASKDGTRKQDNANNKEVEDGKMEAMHAEESIGTGTTNSDGNPKVLASHNLTN